jgi:DNA-binding XRE family transcriptional regulator
MRVRVGLARAKSLLPFEFSWFYFNLIYTNLCIEKAYRITTNLCRFTRSTSFDTIEGMGKAGKALRQVLETYGITQNKLAVALGVKPYAVFRWYHEQTDPTAETAVDIAKALQDIDPAAAQEFIRLYIGDVLDEQD